MYRTYHTGTGRNVWSAVEIQDDEDDVAFAHSRAVVRTEYSTYRYPRTKYPAYSEGWRCLYNTGTVRMVRYTKARYKLSVYVPTATTVAAAGASLVSHNIIIYNLLMVYV